eukprot:TRINITY_DN913_c0_g1_i2.p2 TRINITY_DN913_c0_g1~~TRINITY_DN913_c0_g1_i2.p2  ORF type:complete len:480 (-),score=21.35 TRINITY_DN913_c0_g1_i2:1916-3355(-)
MCIPTLLVRYSPHLYFRPATALLSRHELPKRHLVPRPLQDGTINRDSRGPQPVSIPLRDSQAPPNIKRSTARKYMHELRAAAKAGDMHNVLENFFKIRGLSLGFDPRLFEFVLSFLARKAREDGDQRHAIVHRMQHISLEWVKSNRPMTSVALNVLLSFYHAYGSAGEVDEIIALAKSSSEFVQSFQAGTASWVHSNPPQWVKRLEDPLANAMFLNTWLGVAVGRDDVTTIAEILGRQEANGIPRDTFTLRALLTFKLRNEPQGVASLVREMEELGHLQAAIPFNIMMQHAVNIDSLDAGRVVFAAMRRVKTFPDAVTYTTFARVLIQATKQTATPFGHERFADFDNALRMTATAAAFEDMDLSEGNDVPDAPTSVVELMTQMVRHRVRPTSVTLDVILRHFLHTFDKEGTVRVAQLAVVARTALWVSSKEPITRALCFLGSDKEALPSTDFANLLRDFLSHAGPVKVAPPGYWRPRTN